LEKNTNIKEKVVSEIKNGKSFRKASMEYNLPLSTVVHWCKQKNIKSQHNRADIKATDDIILQEIKKNLLLSATELSILFDYKENAIYRRLNRLVKQKKLQYIVIPGKGKGKKIFSGYIDKRLYYVKQRDLDKWIHNLLPKEIPSAIKRSITQKLHNAGIPFNFKTNDKRVVVVDDPLFKQIRKKAEKQGISASEYVRRKLS
jgi:transposase